MGDSKPYSRMEANSPGSRSAWESRRVQATVEEADTLRAERDALAAKAKELETPRIHSMHIEGGVIEMTLEESTGIVHRMAVAMAGMFEGSGAKNYVQQEISLGAKEYLLTLRPMSRPTPHELRERAESALRAETAAHQATQQERDRLLSVLRDISRVLTKGPVQFSGWSVVASQAKGIADAALSSAKPAEAKEQP